MTTTPPPAPLQDAIAALAHGRPLTQDAVTAAFDVVMRGDASPVQISCASHRPASAWRICRCRRGRGERAAARDGAARPAGQCGSSSTPAAPGGGSVGTFNISTAAAIVAAGAGVRVAKHGNRSFTSKSGSADVLEALGVNIDVDVDAMRRAYESAGIVFMFAPRMHPAMRYVGPVRRELAIPTVMNIVGPLANPAFGGAPGDWRRGCRPRQRHRAGARRAWARCIRSSSTASREWMRSRRLGPTRVLEIRGSAVTEWSTDPDALGVGRGATIRAGRRHSRRECGARPCLPRRIRAGGRDRCRGGQCRGRDLCGRSGSVTRGRRESSEGRNRRWFSDSGPRKAATGVTALVGAAAPESAATHHADDYALDRHVVLVHVDGRPSSRSAAAAGSVRRARGRTALPSRTLRR